MGTTLEQLRSRSWRTQADAQKALRRAGLKTDKGDGWELRQIKRNDWQIVAPEDKPPEPEQPKAKQAKPEHPADAHARKKITQAKRFRVNHRVSPSKVLAEEVGSITEAAALAERWNQEHGTPTGRRSGIYALFPKSDPEFIGAEQLAELLAAEQAAKPEQGPEQEPKPPEPQPEAKPDANDMSPLPPERGPYRLQIEVAQFNLAKQALDHSRKIRGPVQIIEAKGEVVRTIDSSRSSRAGRTTGPKATTGKTAEAFKLLLREQGATSQEIVAITEWSITDRWINRVAKSRNCDIKVLGTRHWRMIPKS